ncbi:hypothetical protein JW887_05440 [Candidatus Dojkabacteria bacterium]|nr:hypothetical protein [Candidatus Dojkabacteria bacterium]
MDMWISLPSVIVPETVLEENDTEIDPLYQNIYSGFSCTTKIIKDNLQLPRACGKEGEELAAATIKSLLESHAAAKLSKVLIDCRSSAAIGGPAPSYKLGAKAGLTSILPFSLSGQSGTEAVQALIFARHIQQIEMSGGIISTVQKIAQPDNRLKANGYPLADAAASVFISGTPNMTGLRFKLLSVTIKQRTQDWESVINSIVKEVISQAGLTNQSVQWVVSHRFSDSFLNAIQKVLPKYLHLIRDLYPEFDFGCVDSFISLNRIFQKKDTDPNGIGLLWFVGRFGAVGAILLELQERS